MSNKDDIIIINILCKLEHISHPFSIQIRVRRIARIRLQMSTILNYQ